MQLSEHTNQGTVDWQLVSHLSEALVDSACTLGVHRVLGGNGSPYCLLAVTPTLYLTHVGCFCGLSWASRA